MAKSLTSTKIVNGKTTIVKTTPAQMKATIKKAFGWNEEQYNKERYKLKNRLRTYEAYKRNAGVRVEAQSPVELLYKSARSKIRYGADYEPSEKLKQIRRFGSLGGNVQSIQKKLASSKYYQEKYGNIYGEYLQDRFGGLLENNEGARKIAEQIKDPVKLEKALSDYADKLNIKIKEAGEASKTSAIPIGETYGSDSEIDFEVEDYL